MKVATALQKARDFRKKQENAQSALAKALMAREANEIHQLLDVARELVGKVQTQLEEELVVCDRRWPDVEADEVAKLAAGFRFVSRWISELEEADFSLTHGAS